MNFLCDDYDLSFNSCEIIINVLKYSDVIHKNLINKIKSFASKLKIDSVNICLNRHFVHDDSSTNIINNEQLHELFTHFGNFESLTMTLFTCNGEIIIPTSVKNIVLYQCGGLELVNKSVTKMVAVLCNNISMTGTKFIQNINMTHSETFGTLYLPNLIKGTFYQCKDFAVKQCIVDEITFERCEDVDISDIIGNCEKIILINTEYIHDGVPCHTNGTTLERSQYLPNVLNQVCDFLPEDLVDVITYYSGGAKFIDGVVLN
jgi:WD40 repeat protein